MFWFNAFIFIAGLYLLIGLIFSYLNFKNAKERRALVDSMLGLRKEAFNLGYNLNVEFGSISEFVGVDGLSIQEESAGKLEPLAFCSEERLNKLVFILYILGWWYFCSAIVEDRKIVRKLRELKQPFARIVETIRKNPEIPAIISAAREKAQNRLNRLKSRTAK